MVLRTARSVDDLLAAVASADLVFTADAGLAAALNTRVSSRQRESLATTPKAWAGQLSPGDEERRIFQTLISDTDLDWRDAAYAMGRILDCWDQTGKADAILDYRRFDRPEIRSALPIVREVDSARQAIAASDPPNDRDVAVIGPAFFSTLDRSILPQDATTVSPFGAGTTPLAPFRLFESRTAIVEAVMANVNPATADRVAIVMDPKGPFPALIESALCTAEIPYRGASGTAGDSGIEMCLALARMNGATDRLRAADLRGILTAMGVEVATVDLEKRVETLDQAELRDVISFLSTLEERTFAELVSTIEDWTDESLDTCRTELRRVELLDQPVTPSRVDDFAFYCRSFDLTGPVDDRGVALVDATAGTVVDRPVVFYLGLDCGWRRAIPNRPWIDRERRDRTDRDQFELLIQNGRPPMYLVYEAKNAGSVRPCPYFHDLVCGTLRTFVDHDHQWYGRPEQNHGDPFPHVPIQAPPDPPKSMSQSRLNALANCPLDYGFGQLVESPDRDYFRKGSLLHDFAELYVNHPAFVEALDRDVLVAALLDEMDPFVDAPKQSLLATEFRFGTRIIERFLREQPPTIRSYEGYRPNFWSNRLADRFGRSITSPITEQWFQSGEVGVSGVVDLIRDPTTLVDYKSGNARSLNDVVTQASIDHIHARPNFQAPLYLAHHRRVVPNHTIELVFVHVLEVMDGAIDGDYAIEDALVRVSYEPRAFPVFAASREAFSALTATLANDHPRRRLLDRIGFEGYQKLVEAADLPAVADPDAVLDASVPPDVLASAACGPGRDNDWKHVRTGLHWLRQRRFFPEDLDAFEAFVAEQRDALETYHRTGFPLGEPNHSRLRHPDMVSTDG